MSQVLINGMWETPPENINEWLNEIVSVSLDMELLVPKRWIRRFELIRAIRKSPRHKAEYVKILNKERKEPKNGI